MREHIAALRGLLTAAGLTSYYVEAPSTAPRPYVLVWSSSGRPTTEAAVSPSSDFQDVVGVTSVADTPEAVLIVQGRARAALAGTPVVAGRLVWLTLEDSRPVTVDRDVTPPRPYGVDLFRLVSVPA